MIYSENTNIRLDRLIYFDHLNEHQADRLRQDDREERLLFRVPEKFTKNQEKTIYKVGFLFEFLKRLYPEKTNGEICEILNNRYQIFLSRRQIDRNVKTFNDNKKYH